MCIYNPARKCSCISMLYSCIDDEVLLLVEFFAACSCKYTRWSHERSQTFSNKTTTYKLIVIKCRCMPQFLWNCIPSHKMLKVGSPWHSSTTGLDAPVGKYTLTYLQEWLQSPGECFIWACWWCKPCLCICFSSVDSMGIFLAGLNVGTWLARSLLR